MSNPDTDNLALDNAAGEHSVVYLLTVLYLFLVTSTLQIAVPFRPKVHDFGKKIHTEMADKWANIPFFNVTLYVNLQSTVELQNQSNDDQRRATQMWARNEIALV